jgi:hypothetical protein
MLPFLECSLFSPLPDFPNMTYIYFSSRNMHRLLLAILVIPCMTIAGQAQSCLPDGLYITRQSEIDSFSFHYPGCVVIEGNLQFQGEDVNNFLGLSHLREIKGMLRLYETKAHTLEGFEGLERLGSLVLDPSYFLENINALGQIDSLDVLDIHYNPALADLSGLSQLTYARQVRFRNIGLTDLTFFNPGLSFQSFILEELQSLKSVNGFPISPASDQENQVIQFSDLDSLTHIEAMLGLKQVNLLSIDDCPMLQSLDGLDSLEKASDLSVYNNVRLVNVMGLQNLHDITDLYIGDNIELTGIEGLENITRIHNLYLTGHPQLSSLEGIRNLEVVENNVQIEFNEITDLRGLARLDSVYGYLILRGNPRIKDLDGLQSLAHIGDLLYLWDNDSLQHISHLTALNSVKSINFYRNDRLTDISLLRRFNKLMGSLSIKENTQLTDLTGLDSLITISDYFTLSGPQYHLDMLSSLDTVMGKLDLEYNDNLTDLSGLRHIKHLGALEIWYNRSLVEISGFDSLEYVGNLKVDNNPVLQSVHGFEHLSNVNGELTFQWNDKLDNIEGIRNFDPETVDSVFIWDCPLLMVCHNQFICDFIATGKPFSLEINGQGCTTLEEVGQGCITNATETSVHGDLNIYPNPTGSTLYIPDLVYKEVAVEIFDLTGRNVLTEWVTTGAIDVSGMVTGVYLVVLTKGAETITQLMVKQ